MTTGYTFQDVHRLPAGPIDFDFYRTRATALRRQVKREARRVRYATMGLVAIVVAFVGILVLTASQTYRPHGQIVIIQTGGPRFE